MTDKGVTRRELLRFLGLEIPLVLVSTQVMTGGAFAQRYTQKKFKVDREILLGFWDNPDIMINFQPVLTRSGTVRGGQIQTLPMQVSDRTNPKGMMLEGATLLAINGEKFEAGSNEKMEAAFDRMKGLIEDYEPLVLDLEIEGQAYQYVLNYK
jgi:hypothetical protein